MNCTPYPRIHARCVSTSPRSSAVAVVDVGSTTNRVESSQATPCRSTMRHASPGGFGARKLRLRRVLGWAPLPTYQLWILGRGFRSHVAALPSEVHWGCGRTTARLALAHARSEGADSFQEPTPSADGKVTAKVSSQPRACFFTCGMII